MKKITFQFFIVILLFSYAFTRAQNFILNSKVELRNWKLTNRAMKSGKFIDEAVIELQNSSGAVSAVRSDAEGNFSLNIPANGDYTLTITYPGQNPKKYLVSTKGVKNNDPNSRPQINIAGMIAMKHVKDMNYLGLDQTHVKIGNSSVIPRTTLNDGEYKLIQKFCTANKLGDMALEKKNYQLAKTFYEMASDMISGEPYPKDQLKKAEDGLKFEKIARKKSNAKQNKVKSAIANQKPATATSKSTGSQSSGETGKAKRKTRMTIGK